MKKFWFITIVLIILGGAVFFLGWDQLTVPPGSFGVMRSKTHGLDAQVISDGAFRWIWYKAIPTNVRVSVFTLGPVRRSIRAEGSLSSGETYAALAGLDADFSWEVQGDIEFRLRPEMLPELSDREHINDNEGLRQYENRLATRIEFLVLQRLIGYAEREDETLFGPAMFIGSIPELNRDILAIYPEIESLDCVIRVVRRPDYALYNAVRELQEEFLAWQSTILEGDLTLEAERRIETRIRLDELTRYGELLTRYPILIQYLFLERGLAPPAGLESLFFGR